MEYEKYKTEYEKAFSALGEDGIFAFHIWLQVFDQRHASFSGLGALKISELNAYLNRLNLPSEKENMMFEYVRYLDRVFIEKRKKQQQ